MKDIIEISHLSKFYGRSAGIRDISLNVPEGSIFGFIGPNGAGKSTTIRILLNLIFPTTGSAKIFGYDVVRDSKKIRSKIGYVPSDANLYDHMKVNEFLQFGATFYKLNNARERIMNLADQFDLDLDRKIPELSMGNKKKVSIIQAMVHHPALLILDEPTSGLDPLIQSRFFKLLHEENKQGTTIFFSSHNLSEVQTFCQSVAIIRLGEIVTIEEIDALRKKQLKRIRIGFSDEKLNWSQGVEGIVNMEKENSRECQFLFSGNINELIHNLSGKKLENLIIEEPPLDEIFLHYYKEKNPG